MILFWMKAFRKPSQAQDEALKQMYIALTAENQKKVNKRNKLIIGLYLSIALLCLTCTVGYLTYALILGVYGMYGLAFDIAFIALSIYATYTSSSWIGAKPYQRLLINVDYAQKLYENQNFAETTESQKVDALVKATNETQQEIEKEASSISNEGDPQVGTQQEDNRLIKKSADRTKPKK